MKEVGSYDDYYMGIEIPNDLSWHRNETYEIGSENAELAAKLAYTAVNMLDREYILKIINEGLFNNNGKPIPNWVRWKLEKAIESYRDKKELILAPSDGLDFGFFEQENT